MIGPGRIGFSIVVDSTELIAKIPFVDLYKKEEGAERECKYVYIPSPYQAWLNAALEPLPSPSLLAYECGIRRSEMLALQRDFVCVRESPDENDEWGAILIKRGLELPSGASADRDHHAVHTP